MKLTQFAATVTGSDIEDGSLSVSLTGSGRDDALFEVVDNQLRIKPLQIMKFKILIGFSSLLLTLVVHLLLKTLSLMSQMWLRVYRDQLLMGMLLAPQSSRILIMIMS